MNPSATFLLSVTVLALAGCGDIRTYPPGETPEPPYHAKSWRSGDPDRSLESSPLTSPVYNADVAVVHAAVARVCAAYFGHLDDNDPTTHRLRIVDKNFSKGDTETIITSVITAGGPVRVDFESHGYRDSPNPSGNGKREYQIIQDLLARLDAEMKLPQPAIAQAPANAPNQPAAKPSAEARMQELEKLHNQKLISDEEYAAKRKAIIDGL